MTEPIKLQDVKQLMRYARIAIEREDALRARAEKAEAERDEARATLERCREVNDATAEGWRKTQIELDEARAELARLTTLRPASEFSNDDSNGRENRVLWWHVSGSSGSVIFDSASEYPEAQWWTPLPPVKEADK
jgi:hypothetical protein